MTDDSLGTHDVFREKILKNDNFLSKSAKMTILGVFGHFCDFLKIFEKIDFSTKIDFFVGVSSWGQWGSQITTPH
jgi:hypothetical protein